MKNFRNKQFTIFKFHAIPSCLMKPQAFLLRPAQDRDVNCLFVQCIHAVSTLPAVSHLATVLIIIRWAILVFVVTAS